MADHSDCYPFSDKDSWPNEALFLVLPYLPLFELLAMSQVCRSLRHAVTTDILPWLEIVVSRPLNLRVSDDTLVAVASRAQGKLQVLALINCARITDDGLRRVVAQNPFIKKLHVPGCTRLSPEGVIAAVKLLTKNNHSLYSLGINGIYGIQKEDLDTLRDLINHNLTQRENDKILYHENKRSSTLQHLQTNRAIDVNMCPKCGEVRIVFDCPKIQCEKKQQQQVSECRGCESCIPRCVECGVCITGMDLLDEAACEDMLCLECWLRRPKCCFCNKPYCSLHNDQQQSLMGATGFLCAACHATFV